MSRDSHDPAERMNESPEFPIPNKSNTLNYNAYLLLTDPPLWTCNERLFVLLLLHNISALNSFIYSVIENSD